MHGLAELLPSVEDAAVRSLLRGSGPEDIPKAKRLVGGGGDNAAAVGGRGHVEDPGGVTLELRRANEALETAAELEVLAAHVEIQYMLATRTISPP